MSLISLYTEILKKNGDAYDIIYIDEYGEGEVFECVNKYRYVNIKCDIEDIGRGRMQSGKFASLKICSRKISKQRAYY